MSAIPQKASLLYSFLFIVSVYSFVNYEDSVHINGVLLILWSIVAGYSLLWLMNRYQQYQRDYSADKGRGRFINLPTQLIYSMHSRETFDSGVRALKTIEPAYAVQALLMFGYILWGYVMVFAHTTMPDLTTLNSHINEFFMRMGSAGFDHKSYDYNSVFMQLYCENLSRLLVIIMVFSIARILSVSSAIGRFLPWLSVASFIVCFMLFIPDLKFAANIIINEYNILGYGWGSIELFQSMSLISRDSHSGFVIRLYENGLGGCACMVFLICILFGLIGRNFFHKTLPTGYAIVSLFILATMVFIDIFVAHKPEYMALSLSGFSAIAGLSVQRNLKLRKRHTLYH